MKRNYTVHNIMNAGLTITRKEFYKMPPVGRNGPSKLLPHPILGSLTIKNSYKKCTTPSNNSSFMTVVKKSLTTKLSVLIVQNMCILLDRENLRDKLLFRLEPKHLILGSNVGTAICQSVL